MCAPQRIVSTMWVVAGAPKRIRRRVRTGVPRRRVSVRESRAGLLLYVSILYGMQVCVCVWVGGQAYNKPG